MRILVEARRANVSGHRNLYKLSLSYVFARQLRSRKVTNVTEKADSGIERELANKGLQMMSINNIESSLSALLNLSENTNNSLKSTKNVDEHLSLLFDGLLAVAFKELGDLPHRKVSENNAELAIFANVSKVKLVFELLEDLLALPEGKEKIKLESLFKAFELAKLIPNAEQRRHAIYVAGRLVYSTGKVRFDPYNEATYLSELATINDECYKEALKLWTSRQYWKDVAGQRWWQELKIEILLSHSDLHQAIKTANSILETPSNDFFLDPEIVTKLVVTLVQSQQDASHWIQFLLSLADKYHIQWGTQNRQGRKHKTIREVTKVEEFLSEKSGPTADQLFKVIRTLLEYGNVDNACTLIRNIRPRETSSQIKVQSEYIKQLTHLIQYMVSLSCSNEDLLAVLQVIEHHVLGFYTNEKVLRKLRTAVAVGAQKVFETKKVLNYYNSFLTKLGIFKCMEVHAIESHLKNNIKLDMPFFRSMISKEFKRHRSAVPYLVLHEMEISYICKHSLELNPKTLEKLETSPEEITECHDTFQGKTYIPPVNSAVYELFLQHAFKKKSSNDVFGLLNRIELVDRNLINSSVISTALRGCTRHGRFNMGVKLLDKFQALAVALQPNVRLIMNIWTFLLRLSQNGQGEHIIDAYFKQFISSTDFYEDIIFYNNLYCLIVSCWCTLGNYNKAIITLQHMGTVLGIQPSAKLLALVFEFVKQELAPLERNRKTVKGSKGKHRIINRILSSKKLPATQVSSSWHVPALTLANVATNSENKLLSTQRKYGLQEMSIKDIVLEFTTG